MRCALIILLEHMLCSGDTQKKMIKRNFVFGAKAYLRYKQK